MYASMYASLYLQRLRRQLKVTTRVAVWVTIIVTPPGYLHRRPASEPSCRSQRKRQFLLTATMKVTTQGYEVGNSYTPTAVFSCLSDTVLLDAVSLHVVQSVIDSHRPLLARPMGCAMRCVLFSFIMVRVLAFQHAFEAGYNKERKQEEYAT